MAFNLALGNANTSVFLAPGKMPPGYAEVINYGGYSIDWAGVSGSDTRVETVLANIVPLDEFRLKNKLTPPNFMKIDVEGHELEVLKGAIKTISTYKPIILLESFQGRYQQVNDFLNGLCYSQIMSLPGDNYLYINSKNTKLVHLYPYFLLKLKSKLKKLRNKGL